MARAQVKKPSGAALQSESDYPVEAGAESDSEY